MKHVFWLIPDKVAGRPGPNVLPWSVAELYAGGIRAVLSVNNAALVEPTEFEKHGIEYACIPFSRNAPPMTGDFEICVRALPEAYAFVAGQLEVDRPVLVHCRSGKDRTGLLFSYFLMQTAGLSAEQALQEVRKVRPIALSALGWETFGLDILRHLAERL